MIQAALLSLIALAAGPIGATVPVENPAPRISQDEEVEAAIRAKGSDVTALLELAKSFEEASNSAAAHRVYERVTELDPDNEAARRALRHQRYDGRWFESYVELAKFKREEKARMKAKGLARWKDEWVPEADLTYLRMGWVRDAQQEWMHPADLAEARQIKEWKAAGYQFRPDDSSWVAPEEFEQWTALLWKCGDEWLDRAAADEFHSNPTTPWELTGERFQVLTTCAWSYGDAARWHADRTHDHLVRLFGIAPATRPTLIVLNGLEQYNVAAADALIDSDGLASLHGAYFTDGAVNRNQDPPRYLGMGVSYWESADPRVGSWGPYWLRWAAAQSFVEAIDPSWDAVSALIADGADGNVAEFGGRFWNQKRIPRWLRYGAAAYVERFLPNPEAAEGADPWDLRAFAFAELKKSGGLRELPLVLAFELDLNDIPGSARLYYEAGLLVAFLLDGAKDDAELQKVHEALRSALASGSADDVRASAKALEAALTKRPKAIRAFAGL